MVKWIIAGFALFPAAELVVFILIAQSIGLGWAVVLLLATTLLGAVILRRAGRGQLAGFRVTVSGRDATGIEANSGSFLTILGGLLLVLPGFITDLIGLMLLFGPVRHWCEAAVHRAVRGGRRDAVVDLEPGEWQRLPDRELESRRDPPHQE
jgi:UPF0716 protein FxsA